MRAEDVARIRHMIDAAETVAQFMSGRQRADLDTDRMLLFAVVRAIEVVGEAAGKVTEETGGMRRIFHGLPSCRCATG